MVYDRNLHASRCKAVGLMMLGKNSWAQIGKVGRSAVAAQRVLLPIPAHGSASWPERSAKSLGVITVFGKTSSTLRLFEHLTRITAI